MKDMSKAELIELVAAVSLRISAFIYALGGFHYLSRLLPYLIQNSSHVIQAAANSTMHSYISDFLFDALVSLVMFSWTVPLARLLCRGLLQSLEFKPSER